MSNFYQRPNPYPTKFSQTKDQLKHTDRTIAFWSNIFGSTQEPPLPHRTNCHLCPTYKHHSATGHATLKRDSVTELYLYFSQKMANGSCQLGGYILSLLAGICAVIAVGIPYWSRDTHNGQVIEAMGYSYGLWWRCVYVSTGHFTCDAYDRIFLGKFNIVFAFYREV